MTKKQICHLNVIQFAKYCGVNSVSIMDWIKKGQIQAFKAPEKGEYQISIENFLKVRVNSVKRNRSFDQSKILILDTDSINVASIDSIFSHHGLSAIPANNGQEALQLLNDIGPSILILDLSMSGVKGYGFLEIMNKLGLRENLWVIIVSKANESELMSAVDMGGDFYLQKPFSVSDLDKIIKKLTYDTKKKLAA